MLASPFPLVFDREEAASTLSSPFASMITDRPLTKFEKRGIGLGHPISDLLALREAPASGA